MKTKELIDKYIIQEFDHNWYRKCPTCKSNIKYIDKYKATYAHNKHSICRKCIKDVISRKLKNHNLSEETKQKIKEKRKLQIITECQKIKISNSLKGRKKLPMSNETKMKLSQVNRGKVGNRKGIKVSEETKRRCRISQIKRFIKLGINACTDEGADLYFNKLLSRGFNFHQNFYLEDIGYFVDGYDKEKNIICEYDTPYHKKPSQIVKDQHRQKNIIEYFEKINNPLSCFIRIDASKKDKLNPKIVYGSLNNNLIDFL